MGQQQEVADRRFIRIAVVCEGPSDFSISRDLAGRVAEQLGVSSTWLEWISPTAAVQCTFWRGIRDLANMHRIKVHGFDKGPDHKACKRAILTLRHCLANLHLIILVRDQDADSDRRAGLEAGRDETRSEDHVVIGLAIPNREAWILVGFKAETESEKQTFSKLRSELGFDPVQSAHRLASGPEQHPKSAKRVLGALTASDKSRETRCLTEPNLSDLKLRGISTGLTAYLEELESAFRVYSPD